MTIYFARDRRDGLIKVGVSKHPLLRARELKADLLGTMPGGVREERLIREMFMRFVVADGSEWLRPEPNFLKFIALSNEQKRRMLLAFAKWRQDDVDSLVERLEGGE